MYSVNEQLKEMYQLTMLITGLLVFLGYTEELMMAGQAVIEDDQQAPRQHNQPPMSLHQCLCHHHQQGSYSSKFCIKKSRAHLSNTK